MFEPKPLDIYLVNVPLNRSGYPRPAIVVKSVTDDYAEVVPLSSAFDLYLSTQHFLIDTSDPAFRETGLRCSSYVSSASSTKISLKHFVKFLGRLEGELAREFKDWYGL